MGKGRRCKGTVTEEGSRQGGRGPAGRTLTVTHGDGDKSKHRAS